MFYSKQYSSLKKMLIKKFLNFFHRSTSEMDWFVVWFCKREGVRVCVFYMSPCIALFKTSRNTYKAEYSVGLEDKNKNMKLLRRALALQAELE